MNNETPPAPSATPPRFLSIPQVTKALGGVSRRTLQRWINSGKLPHVRLGGRVLVPLKALADLEERAFSEAAQRRANVQEEPAQEERSVSSFDAPPSDVP